MFFLSNVVITKGCLICSLSSSLGLFLPFAVFVVDISPLAPSTMVFLGLSPFKSALSCFIVLTKETGPSDMQSA